MPVPDLFRDGLARGWKTHNGAALDRDLTLEADVAIIGSGAGGGTTAEILSAAGYKVLLIEEGPLKTSSDFKLLEDEAYASLYQEGIGRMSKDGAITILQGRAVGGTTLINWTSSFRTPDATLSHWASEYAVKGHSSADMAPWFEKMEQRLGIAPWAMPPNANNDVIRKGCEQLGYSWHVIPRNVRGCFNLGYCGMGCPVNAKQSMLVTTIPSTLEKGGELLYLARAGRLVYSGDRINSLECVAMDERCVAPTGRKITVKARHYVLAGGGINSPALLMRSAAPTRIRGWASAPFAFGELLRGAVRRGDQPVLWRAAVDLFRSLPMAGRHHRQNVVQARSAAAAPGAGQYAARRLRHPERPGHEPIATYPRNACPAARRLPPR